MKICMNATTVTQKENYFSVATNCTEIRIFFLTDHIIRIRAGFDGDFAEESYSLVTTAWEDRMDTFLKDYRKRIQTADAILEDGADQAVIQGKELKVVVEKDPFRICVYDKEGTMIHADIVDLAYREDSNHRRIHTSQETRDNWKEMLKENVLDYGTSSVWNDNCEYDSMVDKDCRCSFEGKGGTIGQLKSVMSNIMCQITSEAVHETFDNTRPYVVCRSGHAGIQRYAQTWAGDNLTCWDSLKYNIATILGMGLSGVANQGCDIGGFYGVSPEAELLVRWIQNGIFQPRFSIHSTNIDNTVTEPWMYSNCTEYIRTAIKFRYRLFPYLYSLMERAHETGLPIMEAMCSAFQNDPKCYEESVDFMFGDSLLVANVVEKGAKTRKVYLPEGNTFYDFYTRTPYSGGQTIELPVDLGSIPLFVKGGAIIPMASNQMKNLMTEQPAGISILCAPDCDGSFTLYEDDGVSMDYEKGCYLKTFISMTAGERTVLTFKQEGSYVTSVETMALDMIHREKAPYWVTVDGKEIPHFLHRRKFEEAECGWYYSQTLKSVQVKYLNPKKDHQVVVSFEQFDLIGM